MATPEKRLRTYSNNFAGAPPSPWQAKRMKIDLIAAKTKIAKLEAGLNHQYTIRKDMQIRFEEEKQSLMDQHKRDERKLAKMEDQLQLIWRCKKELKEDLAEAAKEYRESKTRWAAERSKLHKQIADLKDKLLEEQVSAKDQTSKTKKDMDKLLQAFEGAQAEVEILKKEVAKQTGRAEQCTTLRTQLEEQTLELQLVKNKLTELENERDSYKDWQQQAEAFESAQAEVEILKKEVAKQTGRAEQCTTLRTQLEEQTLELQLVNDKLTELENERDSYKDWQQQAEKAGIRLCNMAEREVFRRRALETNLRDTVYDKLYLQEQVHQLTSRVEVLQPVQQELMQAKVKIASLESSLSEWVSVARAHGVESARALSAALESAFSSQLTAAANRSRARSQTAQLTEELASVKFERDRATTKLTDLQNIRKDQESLIHRLQKRLLLITMERDSYRQQLDCYEKELTVTLCGETGAGSAALLSARVEQLEKALQGYRDLLAEHDQPSQLKALETLRNEVTKWREEAETSKREAQKLRAQRDSLQARMEKLIASQETEIKKLKAAFGEGLNATQSIPEEVEQLKEQLESSRIKLQRMEEEFKEYGDMCCMLLGLSG